MCVEGLRHKRQKLQNAEGYQVSHLLTVELAGHSMNRNNSQPHLCLTRDKDMRHATKRILFGLIVTMTASIPFLSQTSPAQKPSFEVASVKPNNSGSSSARAGTRVGGYYFATNYSVKMLIMQAYRVQDFQVSGGPNWIEGDRFDVEARAEPGTVPTAAGPPDPGRPDTMALMIQSLLEERFQLKLHRDTKELPVYTLSVGNDGSKLQVTVEGRPGPGGLSSGSAQTRPTDSGIQMNGSGISVAMFASMLSLQLRRTVIDKTNLPGMFDFSLTWSRLANPLAILSPGGPELPPPADPSGPSIFTAIQEQLGLKLEAAKGPVEVLVIDSVQ